MWLEKGLTETYLDSYKRKERMKTGEEATKDIFKNLSSNLDGHTLPHILKLESFRE